MRVKISLITPAPERSLSGNRKTASRWAGFLRALGHQTAIAEAWDGGDADALIAVHAWRSAEAIRRFADAHPARPLVVCLAGTDIYRFQHSHPDDTLRSMALAHRLVGLHDLVHRDIPRRFANKLRVIHQSAPPLPGAGAPSKHYFDICVVGHLRNEKDSLRTAYAVRDLPADSRIRIIHMGRAHDAGWARDARREMARNARYRWLDEVPRWRVRRVMRRSRLMVLSSRMEGGANVISEACVGGLPVVASAISGSIGLLGEDYAGTYPVEDTDALRALLLRAEREPRYLATLARQCRARATLFRPARERDALQNLLGELVG